MRPWSLLCAVLLAFLSSQAWAAPVSVLYKRDSEASVARLDPAAQAVLQAMEERLIDSGMTVIQPKAEIYSLLDSATGVVVNFAADAGLTLTIDAAKNQRPNPGAETTWAEVRLRVKAYSGPRVLASFSGFGAVAHKPGAQERAFEVAAKRAVEDVAEKLLKKLDAIPPQAAPAPQVSLVVPPSEAPPAEVRRPAGAKWALMVGVSDFSHAQGGESGRYNLAGVAVDMLTVRKAFTELGVPESRMLWLYNDKATTQGVRQALQTLKAKVGPDDLVYLYLSTHGLPKADGLSRFGIPVTYDFRRDSFIDFEEIRTTLAALAAQDIIWINDTCHSGLAAEGLITVEVGARDFAVAPPAAFDVSKAAAVSEKNIAVLSSATGDQKAADLGNKGGLFSSVFATGAMEVAASGKTQGIYSFYKRYVDGRVQETFHKLCRERQPPGFCTQGTQQPVFGAQQDGKRIAM
jgi:hypothetical protein